MTLNMYVYIYCVGGGVGTVILCLLAQNAYAVVKL